jgi:formimidoylglutamate deiminase
MATLAQAQFYLTLQAEVKTGSILINNNEHAAKPEILHLKNQALVPGFVSAHSHSFQRLLRGLTENSPPSHEADSFWSWRQKMYQIVDHLPLEVFEATATLLFTEMLEAGITHVGEFHYLHHHPRLAPTKDPLDFTRALIRAAQATGINLVILETAYHRYDFSSPVNDSQRRFYFGEVNEYLAFLTAALELTKVAGIHFGAAIHSVRAVAPDWYESIHYFAKTHRLPLHIHASEQWAEVETCVQAHGVSPIALLHQHHLLTKETTLIHATHLIMNDEKLLIEHQPNICLCPATEKNLGDGVLALKPLFDQGLRFSLGTDQNVRLEPFAEAQALEENERIRLRERQVLNRSQGFLFEALWPSLTQHGLSSLYPYVDHTEPGNNWVSFTLPPEYEWHGAKAALDAILIAPGTAKIDRVYAQGSLVVSNGVHLLTEKSRLINIITSFFKTLRI